MQTRLFRALVATVLAALGQTALAQNIQLDWAQLGGSPARNHVALGQNIPTSWDVGEFNDDTQAWIPGSGKNIKWVVRLNSGTWPAGMACGPAISGGKIFVGANNYDAYLPRFPKERDLACLVCFREADGQFLWQYTSERLPDGRAVDWPLNALTSVPYVAGDRLWIVTNRNEVTCFDTEGFLDGENDGPFKDEANENRNEADVVWKFDLIKELGAFPHNLARSSITAAGETLFVCTSNGVDESHWKLANPQAPSFVALDKRTGRVLWSDNTPGADVLHGAWSSPAYAVLGDVPQVIFAGGDGWLYSFDPSGDGGGKSKLLWEFDCNPKHGKRGFGKDCDRNAVMLSPVIAEGRVYVAVGDDPEHGEGLGHLYCIDPTRRGDVSAELVIDPAHPTQPVPHRHWEAARPGELVKANPNSAQVWRYDSFDHDGNGQIEFEEMIHRTCGGPTIKDGLLYIADLSGLFHCLDARTGRPHWTHDLLAACFSTPLIVDGKVYIADEESDVLVFEHSRVRKLLAENSLGSAYGGTPIVVNNVFYITTMPYLFAIEAARK